MLLTIDVGNTNISIGLLDHHKIIGRYRLITGTERTSDEYRTFLDSFLRTSHVRPEQIEDVMISSVVPKVNHTLSAAVVKSFGRLPIMIDHETPSGLTLLTDNPKEIGADLIVDMAAAYHRYQQSCLVLDFGTATTFTPVDAHGVCRYAVICPGLGIVSHTLTENAAKLPEIEIRKPASILAGNTIDAMQAGVVYGYIGLVEKIVSLMKQELQDPQIKVVATGGLGRVISAEVDCIDEYDPDLAYYGMQVIYDKIRESRKTAE